MINCGLVSIISLLKDATHRIMRKRYVKGSRTASLFFLGGDDLS